MAKRDDPFNEAFKDLDQKIRNAQEAARRFEPVEANPEGAKEDEEQVFMEAMSDVRPLPRNRSKLIPSRRGRSRPAHPAPDEEQETMVHLQELVKGSIELDITLTDEYMEGAVRGFSRKLMKRLRKGEFPVQDHIDLHGLTQKEAEARVRDFLVASHRLGHRCVLVVHGRGLNSPESFPVLKENMPRWLGRGPAKKIVLAFATARPYDGGTGAIYVLLRKR